MASNTLTPEVLWAQRSSNVDPEKNYIYLTISVPDVPKEALQLDVKPTKITFTGRSTSLKNTYHVELELFGEIDPAASKTNHTSRDLELKLQKKELKEEYWPRLLKESKRLHFLKTDFDKWVDEDEQNEAPEDDFANFAGGGGMGGGDFGGIDFSKLGGGAGLPTGDEEEEDSDDDMPPLEGEEEEKGETAEDAKDAKEPVSSS